MEETHSADDAHLTLARAWLSAALDRRAEVPLPHMESTAHAAFPADLETLRLIASLVAEVAPRHVVTFGCSPVTELLALLGFEHGRMVVTCFEHDPWAAEEWLLLASPYAINYRWFAFRVCPLVARRCGGEVLPVYDDRMTVPLAPWPADLVIIEGPPPELGGRAGIIYQALKEARPGSLLLLLDVRPDEASMIEGWQRDLAAYLCALPPALLGRHRALVVREPLREFPVLEAPRAQELAARGER